MPNKINDDRRHKFKKMRYHVTNWQQYDGALAAIIDQRILI